jgi:RNA polymerase sigma-70 factor (ECF subfamily)
MEGCVLETQRRRPRPAAGTSDEELLRRVAAGDERALGDLYDRHGRTAYSLAFRVVRDAVLAEDVVQDAFVSVWRTAAAFRCERSKPSTWILTLVHRRAVDLVRREQRRRAEPLSGEYEGCTQGVDEDVELALERRRVQVALRELPADQRRLLELAYYGGLTQSELAERLELPIGTVKSRMFAGLRRLESLLATRDGAAA